MLVCVQVNGGSSVLPRRVGMIRYFSLELSAHLHPHRFINRKLRIVCLTSSLPHFWLLIPTLVSPVRGFFFPVMSCHVKGYFLSCYALKLSKNKHSEETEPKHCEQMFLTALHLHHYTDMNTFSLFSPPSSSAHTHTRTQREYETSTILQSPKINLKQIYH